MTKINARLIALTQEMRYEPDTGSLFWIKSGKGRSLIKPVGSPDKQGYLRVNFNKNVFLAHRIIWFMIYGDLPELIDHKNGQTFDNRLTNLRLANKSTNGANRPRQVNNTSGYKGVSYRERDKSWYVQVKQKDLHYSKHGFTSAKEAAAHYDKIAKNLFGDYSNLNFQESLFDKD